MHYALHNRYPIETDRQVKTACLYFKKNLHRLSPNDRVTAACNIEKRAEDLNVPLSSGWVTNYSRVMKKGAGYSPDFERSMDMRKNACLTFNVQVSISDRKVPAAGIVESLTKTASERSPIETLKAIEEFDKLANLVSHYDTRIHDPYMTVFGSLRSPEWDAEKVAGSKSQYDVIRASRSQETLEKVSGLMGKGFADSFAKEPLKALVSLKATERAAIGGLI